MEHLVSKFSIRSQTTEMERQREGYSSGVLSAGAGNECHTVK